MGGGDRGSLLGPLDTGWGGGHEQAQPPGNAPLPHSDTEAVRPCLRTVPGTIRLETHDPLPPPQASVLPKTLHTQESLAGLVSITGLDNAAELSGLGTTSEGLMWFKRHLIMFWVLLHLLCEGELPRSRPRDPHLKRGFMWEGIQGSSRGGGQVGMADGGGRKLIAGC